jgi:hypothetical protein
VFRTVVRGINVVIRDNKLVVLSDLPSAVDVLAPLIVPATGEMNIMESLTAVLHSARARYASLPPSPTNDGRKSWPSLRG